MRASGFKRMVSYRGSEETQERLSILNETRIRPRQRIRAVGVCREGADAEARIAALEERALARGRDTAALQAEVARLSAAVAAQAQIKADARRLCSAVERLRTEVLALKVRPDAPSDLAELRTRVPVLGTELGRLSCRSWRTFRRFSPSSAGSLSNCCGAAAAMASARATFTTAATATRRLWY
jgi:hypothetical protein